MTTNPMGLSPMALSYSRLNRFENCPSSFEHLYVNKTVTDAGNEKSQYGNRVHETLETYGRALATDNDETAQTVLALGDAEGRKWLPLVQRIVAQPGDKHFEQQMAIDAGKLPTGWFNKDVWLRAIADVLIVHESHAHCLDWKTGKPKNDPTQMQLFAAMVFAHFPEVDSVTTSLVWLAHDDTTSTKYERRFLGALWNALEPRLTAVQDAVDLGVFPTKPSGLCPWCPAREICPDARLKGKR